jgi:CRISPR-associated protein Csb2
MPWDKNWEPFSYSAKTLVFDGFVCVSREDKLFIAWRDTALSDEEVSIMRRLVQGISYLGRAESWCEVKLVESMPEAPNCVPLEEGSGACVNPVKLLSPSLPLSFSDLFTSTADLRKQGFMQPPGTRWVPYEVKEHEAIKHRRRMKASTQRPNTAYFQLSSTVMPHVKETLLVSENVRQAAQSHFGRNNGGEASPTLSGKSKDGGMLKGHQHAFFLPRDEDRNGRLDHFVIWAPSGFTEQEVEAVARLRELKRGNVIFWMSLLYLGDSAGCPSPALSSSDCWVSATPFVLNRYPKKNKDTPADQVKLELERRGFPEPTAIEPYQLRVNGRWLSWLDFKRFRSHRPATGQAYGFRLIFDEPVKGPIALGYACHFGLGQFVPE